MSEQYSLRNNIELAGIANTFKDNDLEETIINICKEHGIEISPLSIKEYHRVPRSNTQTTKDPNQCRESYYKICQFLMGLLQIASEREENPSSFLSWRCCDY